MMHLGLSLTPFGHDPAAWRQAGREVPGFDGLLAQVLAAEQAGFDFVWLADLGGRRPIDELSPLATAFEPTTLVSALSTKTTSIGFFATAATYQHEPYNLARRFASLDTISNGRTGWAVVAGTEETCEREYVDVVLSLWDSWEDDAFIYDKAGGRFFMPQKMHVLNHKGEHFSVRGPLNVNRSPQGRPVLAAEAGSPVADLAEVIFAGADDAPVLRSGARIFRIVSDFGGTPADMAERLTAEFETGGLHGVVLAPPTVAALSDFIKTVLPALRERALVGNLAAAATLRERLGLGYPVHPAAKAEQVS